MKLFLVRAVEHCRGFANRKRRFVRRYGVLAMNASEALERMKREIPHFDGEIEWRVDEETDGYVALSSRIMTVEHALQTHD